jgi:hypothetical protein
MENKLSKLSLQELSSLEQIINSVCRKYENVAQMNKYATSEMDLNNYKKAANSLSYFNAKRDMVLEEMERRINELV